LLGSAGAIVVAGFALKPGDHGGPYGSYFANLNAMLKRMKVGIPTMLIDVNRLQQNALTLVSHIHDIGRNYRIVSKSLPSVDLVKQVMALTGSHRIMTFQQPFMSDVAQAIPHSDLLMGKPMPVDAAERFYAQLTGPFNPEKQLQWLIDTQARLDQYLALAKRLGKKMRINIEIDVGLHRGGLTDPSQMDGFMATIKENPAHLEYAGFMGYDGQVGRIPTIIESAETTHKRANAEYQRYIDYLFSHYPEQKHRTDLTFNGAGSLSVMLHGKDTPLNELSSGSCLVQPSDFDSPWTSKFQPAAFIATPVLKEWAGLKMPGPFNLGEAWQLWDVNRKKTFFIYGGYWKAKPVSPPGLSKNPLYGYSSNQMMYNGSTSVPIGVGDYIFLRPTQSEAVLRHFGDLLAEKDNQLLDWWPPYSQQYDHA
jgi:D-serine deaminase-like pyridoxal phosphate-dependent protein